MRKNLSVLSKEDLLASSKNSVLLEREATADLIAHLREVERRMLFLEMGYSSLWEFGTQYLGLSEGACQRRIATMRLAREIPEVSVAIENGSLNLSTASQLQSFFQQEKKHGKKYTIEEKTELLHSVQNLSKKECEKKLIQLSPESVTQERSRALNENLTELKVVLNQETLQMLQELKDLLAHQIPNATYSELISYLAKRGLEQITKKNKKEPEQENPSIQQQASEISSPPPAEVETGKRPYVKKKDRNLLFKRSLGQCEYISPDGKRCQSRHAIEIDHQVPLGRNGKSEFSNYRVLCKNHNVFSAVQVFGSEHMKKFVDSIR